ncbi:MAG TPA: translocation/assembly module TamB domain-containing protein [Thermoanaerobaculia bacterium]|nr:translocation/assembly module TamB domain-containing protein [Thermoanaerobaculia bacterium]
MNDDRDEGPLDRETRREPRRGAPKRKRRTAARWLRRAALGLLLLLAAVGLAVLFFLTRPAGVRALLDRAGPLLGGELSYDDVEGRLLDGWSVSGLRFRQMTEGAPTGLEIAVDRLSVEWQPTALTRGLLDLEQVEARGVTVVTASEPAQEEEEAPFEPPDLRLPIAVRVDQASLEDLTIRSPEPPPGERPPPEDDGAREDESAAGEAASREAASSEPLTVQQVRLRGLSIAPGGGPIRVERLAVTTPDTSVQLAGMLTPVGDYRFRFDTGWRTEGAYLEEEPPLAVTGSGELSGSLQRIELDQQITVRLEDAGPDVPEVLDAAVSGAVEDPLGRPSADLEVAWSRLRWPVSGDLVAESRGEARVTGDLDRIEVEGVVRASGPNLPEAALALEGATDLESFTARSLELRTLGSVITGSATVSWSENLTWTAQLEGRDLDPSVQWPEWPGRLSVQFAGRGSLDEEGVARTQADLERISGTLRGHPVSATGELLMVGEDLQSLVLAARSGDARLRLEGSLTDQADFDFVAEIPDLGQVLPDASGSLQARGRLRGSREQPVVTAELTANDLAIGPTRLAAASATIDGVVAEGGEVDLALAISAIDSEQLSARDVQLELHGTLGRLELPALFEESLVETRITASRVIAGAANASGVSIGFEGSLGDHVLALAADSAGQPGGQEAAQNLRIRAEGGASEASLDGRWVGTLEELRLLAPGLGRWSLESELALELSSDRVEVGRGCWRRDGGETEDPEPSFVCGEATWSRQEPWAVRAELTGIPLGLLDPLLEPTPECPPAGAAIAGPGDANAETVGARTGAAATGEPAEARIDSETGCAGRPAGSLQALDLEGRLDGRVRASGTGGSIREAVAEITRLEGVAHARLADGEDLDVPFRGGRADVVLDAGAGATLEVRLELPAHDGLVAARVELAGYSPAESWVPSDDQPLSGRLEVELKDPAFLELFIPNLRRPRGDIDADLSLSGTMGRPWLEGAAVVSDASGRLILSSPDRSSEELGLDFADADLEASFDRSGARIELSLLTTDPAGRAQGNLELPGFRLAAGDPLDRQELEGRLEFALDGIAPVAELVPQLAGVQGRIDGSFAIAGSLGAPELDGRAELRDFSAEIPELGVELREGSVTLSGTPGESITLTASVRSGPGTLEASGTVTTTEAGFRTELEIDGTDVTVANTPDIRVRASPDLTVVANADEIHVEGDVVLPWARIELRELPERAIEPSTDIVRVDRPPSREIQPVDKGPVITGRVRLIFGDDFEFEGFGFDVEPRGSLLITETGRGTTLATGQLVLDGGSYKAYGQKLEITEGRMLFGGGPIQNPALAVEAYRTVDSVEAGVRVSGNLQRPIVTLTSNPSMPESDILHYMMLGRAPGAVATANETDLLARAAASLGIKGGNLLARKLAARYDIDELGIETDGGFDTASLVVGKYLSPRLYVTYGIGLFEPISIITLRYILSSKWTLHAEKGRGTGADLIYNIETGRRVPRENPP